MVIYYTEIEMMCIVHLYSRSDLKQFFFFFCRMWQRKLV